MIKTVLLVPLRDNAGAPFRPADWRALEARLLAFGGATREADVTGAWAYAGGRVYRDRSGRYVVALTSWTQLGAWLTTVQ